MGYRAFFSYARADDAIANWLHRQLDGYRTPKPLIGVGGALGPIPAKLHPIFRDRTDLQAGGEIDRSLQTALEDSETLIVLCTPTSAKSTWVNHECETFIGLGRAGRIFPVIAAGEPESGDPTTECFPPTLRGKGLLAADLREIKRPNGHVIGDGKEGGRLKLIAGLLGVPLDTLIQRERRRQGRLLAALGAAAMSFALLAIGAIVLGALAYQNGREAAKQRDAASNTLNRLFASRSTQMLDRGDPMSATRYALAGLRTARSQQSIQELGSALAAAAYASGRTAPPLAGESAITAAIYSDDGHWIATGETNGSARIWDARSARLAATLQGHSGEITSVRFSPDGEKLVSTSRDNTAKLWNRADGALLATLSGHEDAVNSARFSPDGAIILTASDDGHVRLWNGADGAGLGVLPLNVNGGVVDTLISNDEHWMLIHGREESLRYFDMSPATPQPSTINLGVLYDRATISPDSKWIAAAGLDNVVFLIDPATRRVRRLRGHVAPVLDVGFSPDSQRLVSAAGDKTARIWNVATGALVAVLGGQDNVIFHAEFSPDATRVLTASEDGVVRVWDAQSGLLQATLRGHDGRLSDARFSPDGAHVLTAGADRQAKIWELAPLLPRVVRTGHEWTMSASFSADGRHLVTAGSDGAARIWTISTGAEEREFRPGGSVFAARLSPDGATLAAVGTERGVRIYDTSTGQLRATLGDRAFSTVDFSADGAQLLAGDRQGSAQIWNLASGALVQDLGASSTGRAAVARDGSQFLTAGQDNIVRTWDARTHHLLRSIEVAGERLRSADFSPDRSRIVTGGADGVGRVWSVADGRQILALVGHTGPVQSAHYSPDGKLIATSSQDRSIKIWDAADGRLAATLTGHTEMLIDAQFSPSGETLVSAAWDGTARLWSLGRLTAGLAENRAYACANILGRWGRSFSLQAVRSDPLLQSPDLQQNRDVCARH